MEMNELGFNYRLTDFQAALGISQMNKAESGLQRRIKIAEKYEKSFEGKPITNNWDLCRLYSFSKSSN